MACRTIQRLMSKSASAFLALALMLDTAAVEAASQALDMAQTLYARGDAAEALPFVDAALKANAADANAHYLKGNCLVKLGRLNDARVEYWTAEHAQPGSAAAGYAKSARLSVESVMVKRIKQASSAQAQADTADSGSESGEEAQDTDTPSNSKLPPGTLELIRKQASLARQRAESIGKIEAENELNKANVQAKTLQERAEHAAAQPRNSSEAVQLTPEEVANIRSQAANSADRIRDIGKMKANIKQWEAAEKSDEIKNQSENLQRMLIDPSKSGNADIKLNPVGTNLYTRNYQFIPSKITPLRAQPQTLTEVNGSNRGTSATVNGSGAGSQKNGHGLGVKTSVKGQLMPIK